MTRYCPLNLSPEEIEIHTGEWTGERFPDGRPKVADDLADALAANFDGHEDLRQRLLNRTPKYGNDDDYADDIAADVFDVYYDAFSGQVLYAESVVLD